MNNNGLFYCNKIFKIKKPYQLIYKALMFLIASSTSKSYLTIK